MGSGGRRQEAINDDEEIALEGDPQAKPPQGRPASESAAWDYVYGLLEKHDREMIKQYSESIDNLLIFASLFSAVLSTFLFEAYDNNRLTVQLLYNEPLQLQQMSTSQIAPASFDPLSALFRVNSKLGRGQRRLAPKPHPHRLFLSVRNFRETVATRVSDMVFHLTCAARYPAANDPLRCLPAVEGPRNRIQIAVVLFFARLVILPWPIITAVSESLCIASGVTMVLAVLAEPLPLIYDACAYMTSFG